MKIGGKTVSNWWLIGGGVGAVLVFYLYKRSSSGSSTSPGSSGTTGIDPLTNMPYSQDNTIDPLTNMTYLQEAQTYGSVSAAEAQASTGSAYGLAGGYGGYGGTAGYPTSNVGYTAGTAAGQSYATNAAWAQAVTAGLAGLGYDSQTIASALGLFFAQHPLSSTQAQIIQAAEAEYGPPPQGTYQIIPQGNGTGSGGGGNGGSGHGGGGGEGGGSHHTTRLAAPSALHVTATYPQAAQIAWNDVKGATGYTVQLNQGSASGRKISGPWVTQGPFANFGGLHSKTHYTATVWPVGSGQQPHSSVSFTTK